MTKEQSTRQFQVYGWSKPLAFTDLLFYMAVEFGKKWNYPVLFTSLMALKIGGVFECEEFTIERTE